MKKINLRLTIDLIRKIVPTECVNFVEKGFYLLKKYELIYLLLNS